MYILQESFNKHYYYYYGLLDEKIVYAILILVNYNYEMSKKGVLGFSISYLVLEIYRFFTYVAKLDSVDVIVSPRLK